LQMNFKQMEEGVKGPQPHVASALTNHVLAFHAGDPPKRPKPSRSLDPRERNTPAADPDRQLASCSCLRFPLIHSWPSHSSSYAPFPPYSRCWCHPAQLTGTTPRCTLVGGTCAPDSNLHDHRTLEILVQLSTAPSSMSSLPFEKGRTRQTRW
jgi:hypothetical protein